MKGQTNGACGPQVCGNGAIILYFPFDNFNTAIFVSCFLHPKVWVSAYVIHSSSNYNFVIFRTIFDTLSVSNKSLFHLVVEAKLMVLEAGQDQALELEADYELFLGLG